jgi:hypothetical protein
MQETYIELLKSQNIKTKDIDYAVLGRHKKS